MVSLQPCRGLPISIHALRGEGDLLVVGIIYGFIKISIHALRGEGDDICIFRRLRQIDISIHALRGEGDLQAITSIGI